jgi:hypothetical protein
VNRQTGQEAVKQTPLSDFVLQGTQTARTFEDAANYDGLRTKVKTGKAFEATDVEFETVANIFKRSETDAQNVFRKMVEAQNKGFDLVAWEKGVGAATAVE